MTIRTRILLAVAGTVLPMTLAVLAAYSSYAREHDASGALLSALERIIQAERADDALVDMRLALAARVVYRETAALARFEQSYARLVTELTRLEGLAAAEARAAGRIRGIRTAVEDWRRLEADAIIRAAEAGREAEAMTRLRAARDGAQAARDALFGFIADERGVAEAQGARGARTHRMAQTLMLASVALVVAGGALAGWLLVRRLEALERARHEAESFVDVQRDLAETLDLGRILARVARHARVLCESDVSGIAICDPQSGAGAMVALDGAQTDALFALRIEPGRAPGPVAAEGIETSLAVPVALEQERLGYLYVASRSRRAFGGRDEALLLGLAVPAALAIRNAGLVRQMAADRDLLAAQSRELARSAAHVRAVFDAAGDGILTVDRLGWITSANRAAAALFGHDAAELLEVNLEALLPKPAGDPGAGRIWLSPTVTDGRRREVEGARRDGRRVPLEISVSRVGDGDDAPFVLVLRDVTEQKAAQEAAVSLAAIVASSDDAIVGVDLDDRITSWNPGATALYGYHAEEVMGRPATTLVPKDREAERAMLLERLARDERVTAYETVRLARDGRRIDVSLTMSRIVTPAGRATGISTISRDIGAQKAVARMKDEFIGMVSHELRTPLTAIRGHLELVMDGDAGPVTETQRAFLAVASQNTDRLGALINDLLDVEKIESGRVAFRNDPVDLTAVLDDAVTTFRLAAERKGLGVEVSVPPLPAVVGDRDRLVQVFANLLSNAIKYTPSGAVGVRAERVDGSVVVDVHDTGIGMTEPELSQLFTRFFRGQDAVVRDAGGTGLGLVIARGIVERHGGSLEVTSRPGEGSCFRVRLPAALS